MRKGKDLVSPGALTSIVSSIQLSIKNLVSVLHTEAKSKYVSIFRDREEQKYAISRSGWTFAGS